MAEFMEVMRHYSRMCKAMGTHCDGCLIHGERQGNGCLEFLVHHPDRIEALVMRWAVAHPEKSMKDVLLERFPKALVYNDEPETCAEFLSFGPCPNKNGKMSCKECWNRPAPEEVEG